MVILSLEKYPQIKLTFGGKHAYRESEIIDAEDFIAIKGVKARGKRLSTYVIDKISELKPIKKEEPKETNAPVNDPNVESEVTSVEDEDAPQMTLEM